MYVTCVSVCFKMNYEITYFSCYLYNRLTIICIYLSGISGIYIMLRYKYIYFIVYCSYITN